LQVRPRSPAQAAYLDMMRQCPLVFGIGPAGTGKTFLAVACAAAARIDTALTPEMSTRAISRRGSGSTLRRW